MRVFVAGATGVIGSRAVPALVAAGHEVTAVARGPIKAEQVRQTGATPLAVDLFDREAVAAAVAGHEVVVNLATKIPPMTRAARASAWAENERLRREASAHLVDAARSTGAARIVQESICFPYLDAGDAWIDETAPRDAVGPFAGAAVAEVNAARATADGAVAVVLRFAQLYGAGHHQAMFDRLLRRRINPFLGPPEAYSSWVHVEDAGRAVVAALSAPAGTYNVVDDEPLTRAEAGAAAAAALGRRAPRSLPAVVRAALPASARLLMRSQRVSNAAFREAAGWRPTRPSIRGAWAS